MGSKLVKPFQLKIGNRQWKVRFVSAAWLKAVTGGSTMGLCDYEISTIYINKNMHIPQIRVTLFHEITHAMLEPNMGSNDQHLGLINEEICANLLGSGLAELLLQPLPAWLVSTTAAAVGDTPK